MHNKSYYGKTQRCKKSALREEVIKVADKTPAGFFMKITLQISGIVRNGHSSNAWYSHIL